MDARRSCHGLMVRPTALRNINDGGDAAAGAFPASVGQMVLHER